VLAYIEQENVGRRYNPNLSPTDTTDTDGDGETNLSLGSTVLKVFRCPAMRPPTVPAAFPGYASYAVCIGNQPNPFFGPGSGGNAAIDNGVIVRSISGGTGVATGTAGTTMVSITDGTSNTVLVSEMGFQLPDYNFTSGPYAGQHRGGNTQWVWGYASYSFGSTGLMMNTITGTPANLTARLGAFRADHPNSVNFTFSDGSVRTLRPGQMPLEVYQAIGTRNGGEVAVID
jgi:prepilin-type processing-associated H-X9-DG protein